MFVDICLSFIIFAAVKRYLNVLKILFVCKFNKKL